MDRDTKNVLLMVSLFLLFMLVPICWFREEYTAVAGYDYATSLKPLDDVKRSLYLWDERLYTGSSNIISVATLPYFLIQYIFQYMAGSLYRGQMLFFILLFILPGLSMYYFLRSTFDGDRQKNTISFFGSIFYMFNAFVVVKWNRGELLTLFSYGLLPIYLGLVDRGLKGRFGLSFIIVFIISILLLPVTIGHTADFLIVVSVVSAFTLWHFVTERGKMVMLKRLSVLGASAVLLNAWWIFPLAGFAGTGVDEASSFTATDLSLVNYYSSWATMLNLFKMWFFPTYATQMEFSKQFYRPGTILFPLVAFSSLLFTRRSIVIFFAILGIAGLWLSKGTFPPFPDLYKWLYLNVPYFFIFRAPTRYFPLIYTISLAVLVGYCCARFYLISERLLSEKRTILKVVKCGFTFIIIFLIFFHAWPLFSRDTLFRTVKNDVLNPSVFVNIPPYYESLNQWFKSKDGYYRIHSFLNKTYLNYTWGYSSTDIAPKMIEIPQTVRFQQELVFGNEGFQKLINTVDRAFWEWDFGRIGRILGLLSVRYVTIIEDVMRRYLPDTNYYEILQSVLEDDPDLKPAVTIERAKVYRNIKQLPHIFMAGKGKIVFGGYEALIPLSYTEYLDEPALFFHKGIKGISATGYGMDEIVFVDENIQDIVCEGMDSEYRYRISDDSAWISIYRQDVYILWGRKRDPKPEDITVKVKIDDMEPSEDSKDFYDGFRWIYLGRWTMAGGDHKVTVQPSSQIEEIVVIPLERWNEDVRKIKRFLDKNRLPLTHIIRLKDISKGMKGVLTFYTTGGNYTVTLDKLPYWLAETRMGFLEDYTYYPDIKNWFVVDGDISIKAEDGIKIILRGGDKARVVKRIEPQFDPEEYPYLDINGEIITPDNLKIDVTVGIDLDGNRWSDEEIKIGTFEKDGLKVSTKLSSAFKRRFGYPGKKIYRPVWVSFNIKNIKNSGLPRIIHIRRLGFYHKVPLLHVPDDMEHDGITLTIDGQRIDSGGRISFKRGVHTIGFETNGDIQGSTGDRLIVISQVEGSRPYGDTDKHFIDYMRINPTRYEIRIVSNTEPFWLIFNERFHQGWHAFVVDDSKKTKRKILSAVLPVAQGWGNIVFSDHRIINGYANGWWIDRMGTYKIVIEFLPQRGLVAGFIITLSSVSGVFVLGSVFYIRTRITKYQGKE